MAINYTTLFARIGKGWYLAGMALEFCGASGSVLATDLPTESEDFVEQYDSASPTIRGIVAAGTSQLENAQGALAPLVQWVADAIAATILEMADADNPLTERTTYESTRELIRQMIADSKTINANATSATVTYGAGNVGNGVVVAFMLDTDGYALQCCYDEDLSGAFVDASTAGSERASISGETSASDLLSHSWPKGSGASGISVTSTDAVVTNLITNGAFEDFTVADTPDSWTIVSGAVATEIFEDADVYRGDKCLKLVGTSSFKQTITGLASRTPYALHVALKHDSSAASGDLNIKLRAIGGTDALDSEAATEVAEVHVSLSTIGTAYETVTLAFTLKEPLPAAGVEIFIEAAVEAAKSLFVDELSLVPMQQMYAGGPWVAIFSGSANWSLDDTFNVAVANDYGGKVMLALWRSLNLPELGLRIPFNTGGTENIADSVIA